MYFLQKDDIMLHFTLSGSSDITDDEYAFIICTFEHHFAVMKYFQSYFSLSYIYFKNFTCLFQVRNLKNLGFRVPLAIVNKAHQANQLYPFAISLIESVRTYERSLEKLDNRPKIVLLLAGLHKEVQNLVAEGIGLVWESYKLDPYVQRLVDF